MDVYNLYFLFLTPQAMSNDDKENFFHKVKATNNNVLTHASNGNKKIIKIKVLHANKGLSDLVNKIDLIMTVIKDLKSDITCITEANFNYNDPKSKAAIAKATKGFKIEISGQSNVSHSRCIMIIH